MLTVVGSIAFDSVETPFGSVERELGGSAVYSALAASSFTRVRGVGPVGDDFTDEHYAVLENVGVDTGGVQAIPGKDTFRWRGRYDFSFSAQSVETVLNAFDGWRPRLAMEARESSVLFLAAMDPEIQLDVRAQAEHAGCVALDSMTYWIQNKRDALTEAIRGVDIVMMNDHEARELTEQPSLLKAAREISSWGPRAVVIRLGEYGCALLGPGGYFSIPGYPLEQPTDPTGGGDAFAGGFLGYLDLVRGDWASEEVLRRAVTYGCVMSSFCIEEFGARRLLALTRQEIDYRFTDFRQMTHFEHVPLHPRPRDPEAREHPAALERPAPTPTTGPRKAPPPTAGTPTYRSPPRTPSTEQRSPGARIWNEPHSFRRLVGTAEGRSPLASPVLAGTVPSSSPSSQDRKCDPDVDGSGRQGPMLYCVVAREAPRKVVEALGRHFENDPTVSVVVDQRSDDRRASRDRRGAVGQRARITERRKVRHPAGRRVAERRAVLGPAFREVSLPRQARAHARHIVFGTRAVRSPEFEDDTAAARLALAHQSGDTRAFEDIYSLWFDRMYTMFRTVHTETEDVEDAVNAVFARAFEHMGGFIPSLGLFRTWLAAFAASIATSTVSDGEGELAEARMLDRWSGPPDLEALSWLRDEELILLIRQLPSPQREVISLH